MAPLHSSESSKIRSDRKWFETSLKGKACARRATTEHVARKTVTPSALEDFEDLVEVGFDHDRIVQILERSIGILKPMSRERADRHRTGLEPAARAELEQPRDRRCRRRLGEYPLRRDQPVRREDLRVGHHVDRAARLVAGI